MTVCEIYFQFNIMFLISVIASLAVISFLTIYLPSKKIKSKWKYAFIPLFIFLIIIVVALNVGLLGMKNTCSELFKTHFVADLNQEVDSIETAKVLLRPYAMDSLYKHPNDTFALQRIQERLDNIKYVDSRYSLNLGFTCFSLYDDGRLYKYYCGH